nr:Uncharacterised protein [Klebsiella pneumoniae]
MKHFLTQLTGRIYYVLNYVIMFFTSVILEAKACIACVESLSAANFRAGRHCDKTGILIWYGYLNSQKCTLYAREARYLK